MSLRHNLSLLFLTTSMSMDVGIHCDAEKPQPEPKAAAVITPTTPVTAMATGVESLYRTALRQPRPLREARSFEEARTLTAVRLGALRARVEDVERLSETALACAGVDGLLRVEPGEVHTLALTLHARLDEQTRLATEARDLEALIETQALFELDLWRQAQRLLDESMRIVDEAGAHGCPLSGRPVMLPPGVTTGVRLASACEPVR